MNKVLVLMSTYNGSHYLKEQIDSILEQKDVEVYLLVRDDGSKDVTREVLDNYSKRYSNISWYTSDNIGFVKSFTDLMNRARELDTEYDFYAFSDQDDIWMPDKLANACKILSKMKPETPNLYTSNSIQIDSKGDVISVYHMKCPTYKKGNIIIYGTEQGCSMTFNRKALDFYCSIPPNKSYHDRWLYMICFYLGTAYYDHEPRFYYRIHNNNAIGKISDRDNENIVMRFFSSSMFKPLNNHLEMACEFYKQFKGYLSKKDSDLLLTYSQYRTNVFSKFKMMIKRDYSCPYSHLKIKFYYFVCLLFNKI